MKPLKLQCDLQSGDYLETSHIDDGNSIQVSIRDVRYNTNDKETESQVLLNRKQVRQLIVQLVTWLEKEK